MVAPLSFLAPLSSLLYLHQHDGPQHFAALHLVERLFHVVDAYGLGYEAFQVEPALAGAGL